MDDTIYEYGVESDELLSVFVSLESATLEDDVQKSSVEIELPFFKKIKSQIENNVSDLKTVVVDLNKLRGKF